MTLTAVVLLLALLVAHDLGDFTPLATARIRQAKTDGGPMGPIAVHAAIHAVLVGIVVLGVIRPPPTVLGLAMTLEFLTHFAIDAGRARLGLRVRALADMHSNPFWWALGVDQLLHTSVLVAIAVFVLG